VSTPLDIANSMSSLSFVLTVGRLKIAPGR